MHLSPRYVWLVHMVQTVSALRTEDDPNSNTAGRQGRQGSLHQSTHVQDAPISYFPITFAGKCRLQIRWRPTKVRSKARHGKALSSGGVRRHRTSTQLTSPSPSDIESDLFLRLRTTISSRTFPYEHPGARARERGFLLVSVRNKFTPGAGDVVRFILHAPAVSTPYEHVCHYNLTETAATS